MVTAVWEPQVTGLERARSVEVGGNAVGGCPNPGAKSGKVIDMQTAWKALE